MTACTDGSVTLSAAAIGMCIKTYFARGHHHTSTNSVKWIGSDTGTSSDGPPKSKGSQEVAFQFASEQYRFDRVVHAKVETAVDDDTSNRGAETTVQAQNTVRGKRLLVNVHQSVELSFTSHFGALSIIGKTSTGVVEGVDEEEGCRASSLSNMISSMPDMYMAGKTDSAGGEIAHHPLSVTITLLLVSEHGLVGVSESEVEGLGWKVSDNIGSVTSP